MVVFVYHVYISLLFVIIIVVIEMAQHQVRIVRYDLIWIAHIGVFAQRVCVRCL